MMKIKKQKAPKKCVIKRKIKFQDYKSCLEAAEIKSKINHLEKNRIRINAGSLKENQK